MESHLAAAVPKPVDVIYSWLRRHAGFVAKKKIVWSSLSCVFVCPEFFPPPNFAPCCPSPRAHRAETSFPRRQEGWSLTTPCWSERLPAPSPCRRASCCASRPTSPDNTKSWSVPGNVSVFAWCPSSVLSSPHSCFQSVHCVLWFHLHNSWPGELHYSCSHHCSFCWRKRVGRESSMRVLSLSKRFCQNPLQLFLVVCSLIECKPPDRFPLNVSA